MRCYYSTKIFKIKRGRSINKKRNKNGENKQSKKGNKQIYKTGIDKARKKSEREKCERYEQNIMNN